MGAQPSEPIKYTISGDIDTISHDFRISIHNKNWTNASIMMDKYSTIIPQFIYTILLDSVIKSHNYSLARRFIEEGKAIVTINAILMSINIEPADEIFVAYLLDNCDIICGKSYIKVVQRIIGRSDDIDVLQTVVNAIENYLDEDDWLNILLLFKDETLPFNPVYIRFLIDRGINKASGSEWLLERIINVWKDNENHHNEISKTEKNAVIAFLKSHRN